MMQGMIRTHGSSGYKRGCRCEKCRAAEATRQRRYRARNPRAQIRGPKHNVVSFPTTAQPAAAPTGLGEVEQAVRLQLAGMPKALERQGEAAAAIRLAQLLDSPDHFALAAQNSYKLHVILNSLGAPKKKAKSRLAAIESMTSRKPRSAAQ
jgi:hypothetical protein